MGINLTDTTNDPGISLIYGSQEAPGNYDDWNYVIDVSKYGAQFDENGNPVLGEDGKVVFSPDTNFDEIITITGNWNNLDGGDGWPGAPNGGDYVVAQIPNPSGGLYFGDLNIDQHTGEMTWSFTVGDLQQYAGQNYDVYFVGKYANQQSDSDLLKLTITCFIDGTMIATPGGEIAIEELKIGDMISTADGRSVPVRWMGRKTIKSHVMLPEKVLPVRISAGSLGNGLPRRDLYLSADHGLIVDDMLVNAGALVNDSTICFVDLDDMPSAFTYWHIETENHDEIVANGTPAETFVDYIGRTAFDNHQEYLDLYGAERIIPEMKRLRISARRQLPAYLCERLGVQSLNDQIDHDFEEVMAKLKAA